MSSLTTNTTATTDSESVDTEPVAATQEIVAPEDMVPASMAILDTWIPGHERTTTLFFGHIVSNPNEKALFGDRYYGYNLTYSGCDTDHGNAKHWHDSLEIFAPVNGKWRVAYEKSPGEEETLIMEPGMCIGVPAGVPRMFRRVDSAEDKKELLTILPGKASVTWEASVVTAARAHGADCDNAGVLRTSAAKRARVASTAGPARYVGSIAATRRGVWQSPMGRIAVSSHDLEPGQKWESTPSHDVTALVLSGVVVAAGKKLQPMSIVSQPEPLQAAGSTPARILVIESNLPHTDQFLFDAQCVEN